MNIVNYRAIIPGRTGTSKVQEGIANRRTQNAFTSTCRFTYIII
jgi:hypothetical protein